MGLDPSGSTRSNYNAKSLCSRIGIQSATARHCENPLKSKALHLLCRFDVVFALAELLFPQKTKSFQPYYSFREFLAPLLLNISPSEKDLGLFFVSIEVPLKNFFLNKGAVFLSVKFCQQSWCHRSSLQVTFKWRISDSDMKCSYAVTGVFTESRKNQKGLVIHFNLGS